MTPQEALSILDQAAQLAPLNRQTHLLVIQAVEALNAVISPPPNRAERRRQAKEEARARIETVVEDEPDGEPGISE